MENQELLGAVLSLPPEERARVAREILVSLHGSREECVEEAWAKEIEKRYREVEQGEVELLDLDHVLRRVEARLAARRDQA